jgi:cyclase
LFKRIIPSILLNKSKVIKGENFRNHKENGDAVSMVKIYNAQMADEILVLDIKLRNKGDKINFELLKKISKNCFIPLCYGGGLDNENEVFKVLQSGFEKVFINNSAFKNTIFIKKLISIFGGQAIVVGVDYGYENQTPRVFINSGKKRTEEHPLEYIKELQKIGVGEIILTNIDREGCRVGLDTNFIKFISNNVAIPIIASGGAGSLEDFVLPFKNSKLSGIAAGKMLLYSDNNLLKIRNYMKQNNINVRMNFD